MSTQLFTVLIKETNEKVIVYKLKNGNFYDFENMAKNLPPTAKEAGKKEFTPNEVTTLTIH